MVRDVGGPSLQQTGRKALTLSRNHLLSTGLAEQVQRQ
jgi:hypothetical protein